MVMVGAELNASLVGQAVNLVGSSVLRTGSAGPLPEVSSEKLVGRRWGEG